MPGFDATGPSGQGAMTGWGQGRCGGDAQKFPQAGVGRGGGRIRGGYQGRGRYQGRGGYQGRGVVWVGAALAFNVGEVLRYPQPV
jgi:hypothetical protein